MRTLTFFISCRHKDACKNYDIHCGSCTHNNLRNDYYEENDIKIQAREKFESAIRTWEKKHDKKFKIEC